MAVITRGLGRISDRKLDRSLGGIVIEEEADDRSGEVLAVKVVNGSDRAVKLYAVDDDLGIPYEVLVEPGESGRIDTELRPDSYQVGLNFMQGRSRPGSVGVPSELANNQVGGTGTTLTVPGTGGVTPTGGALLIVVAGASPTAAQGATSTTAVADTFDGGGSLTWTEIGDVDSGSDGSRHAQAAIWWAKAPASPAEGAVTVTWPSNQGRKAVLLEIAGANTTTPVSESDSATQLTGSTLALSFTGVAAANRSIATIYANSANDIAPGTGETEGGELTNNNLHLQWQYGTDPGDDATPTWSNLADAATAAVAFEIAAAVAPAGFPHSQAVFIS